MLVVPVPPNDKPDDIEDGPPAAQDQHLPFTRSSASHIRPFTPVWANEKWENLVQGTDLLQCLDINGARRIGDWISGARAAKKDKKRDPATTAAIESFIGQGGSTSRRRAIQSISGTGSIDPRAATTPTPAVQSPPLADGSSTSAAPQAPEGFWEHEMPPYEDRSSDSDPMTLSDDATGIGAVHEDHPGPHTITVKLIRPGRVTLELTKSSMPIYHISKSGSRTRVTTHTYTIITTIPRSALIPNSNPDAMEATDIPDVTEPTPIETDQFQAEVLETNLRTTILPNPSSPMRALSKALPRAASLTTLEPPDYDLTPIDNTMITNPLALQPGRSLVFNRDGTMSRQQSGFPAGATDQGLSLDVHELLETTDWSKTGLGPRDQWPQSLKGAGQSPFPISFA